MLIRFGIVIIVNSHQCRSLINKTVDTDLIIVICDPHRIKIMRKRQLHKTVHILTRLIHHRILVLILPRRLRNQLRPVIGRAPGIGHSHICGITAPVAGAEQAVQYGQQGQKQCKCGFLHLGYLLRLKIGILSHCLYYSIFHKTFQRVLDSSDNFGILYKSAIQFLYKTPVARSAPPDFSENPLHSAAGYVIILSVKMYITVLHTLYNKRKENFKS